MRTEFNWHLTAWKSLGRPSPGDIIWETELLNHSELVMRKRAYQNSTLYATFPRDPCDSYVHCGGNGNSVLNSSLICQCLKRFVPGSLENWNLKDFLKGCVRRKPFSCRNDGFAKYLQLKLLDTTHNWINKSKNLVECMAKCLSNCSCSAYTDIDVRGRGSSSAIWFE
ncbi:S-locus-specific glycoprotein S13-like [Pyrus x bretschneideri]|uniref:S-locus-specific glycoprotein S13-like n=1 Tax=Pyrus x bretschneideri TaxID=225117 RepID=UPI002030C0AD|nr:S-locus-specific glycoprotein S13-like [Pyrus x bretschneideri]